MRSGPDWLRARLSAPRVAPVTEGDGHLVDAKGSMRPASVLIPVVARADGLSVMFTRRTAHLSDHAGQISFPGGRTEPQDASPVDTALRETEEEVGLTRDSIEIVGSLHDYFTVTRYRVTPVVGLVTEPFELNPDAFEVAEVFEVPLSALVDPSNHQSNSVMQQGRQRRYWAVPWRHYYIWGATAGIVMNLSAQLRG